MTQANINIEDLSADTKIAHMQGQLDESNIDEKIKEIYSAIEKVPKGLKLIFDFSSLDYMNSKSIGYLTDIYGKVTEGGGRVIIAAAKPNIADILQVVGLTQIIENFATLDEAKKKMETPVQAISQSPASSSEPVQASPVAPASDPVQTPAAAPEVKPQTTEAATTSTQASSVAPETKPQAKVNQAATPAPAQAPAPTSDPTSASVSMPAPVQTANPNPQPGAASATSTPTTAQNPTQPATAAPSHPPTPGTPAPPAPTNTEESTYTFEKQ